MNTPATYGNELVLALIALIDPVAKYGEDVDRALLAEKLQNLADGLEDDDEVVLDLDQAEFRLTVEVSEGADREAIHAMLKPVAERLARETGRTVGIDFVVSGAAVQS